MERCKGRKIDGERKKKEEKDGCEKRKVEKEREGGVGFLRRERRRGERGEPA